MTARVSNLRNAFRTQLTAAMGPTDTTATVGSTSGMTSPSYLVIDPRDGQKREYIYFDGVFTGTTFVTTVIANRYLSGSAAVSGITHSIGAEVWCVPTQQHFEDLHDRIALSAPLASPTFTGAVTLPGAPSSDLHAATKAYVDAGAVTKRVRVATTAAGTLATSFENGATVDGVVLATGDRVLLKNQAAGAENGIYVVAAAGAPARAADLDTSAKTLPNLLVEVAEGTTNADTVWQLTTNAPITLGTTALVFAQFGASAAGGITQSSASVAASQSTTAITPGDLTTVGPAVTLVTGTEVLVWVGARMYNNGVQRICFMDVAVSGATTRAAVQGEFAYSGPLPVNEGGRFGFLLRIGGLTAGSNTFTAKYSVTADAGFFQDRTITVIRID